MSDQELCETLRDLATPASPPHRRTSRPRRFTAPGPRVGTVSGFEECQLPGWLATPCGSLPGAAACDCTPHVVTPTRGRLPRSPPRAGQTVRNRATVECVEPMTGLRGRDGTMDRRTSRSLSCGTVGAVPMEAVSRPDTGVEHAQRQSLRGRSLAAVLSVVAVTAACGVGGQQQLSASGRECPRQRM